MSFADELRDHTRSKSDIQKEEKERIKAKSEEYAINDYKRVKAAFREAAKNGNYTECGTKKEIVVYTGDSYLEGKLKNFISSYIVPDMRRSEHMNSEVSRGFFSKKVHLSYTFSVIPNYPFEYECYVRKIQELSQADSIDMQEVVVYIRDMREYAAHFPWVYTTSEHIFLNYLYPCLKFRIKY